MCLYVEPYQERRLLEGVVPPLSGVVNLEVLQSRRSLCVSSYGSGPTASPSEGPPPVRTQSLQSVGSQRVNRLFFVLRVDMTLKSLCHL